MKSYLTLIELLANARHFTPFSSQDPGASFLLSICCKMARYYESFLLQRRNGNPSSWPPTWSPQDWRSNWKSFVLASGEVLPKKQRLKTCSHCSILSVLNYNLIKSRFMSKLSQDAPRLCTQFIDLQRKFYGAARETRLKARLIAPRFQ